MPGALTPPGGEQRRIRLAGRDVEYGFARRRRRTIGLIVDAGGLRVSAPMRAPWDAIEGFLRAKERWIVSRLEQWARAPRAAPFAGISGEALPLAGETVVLEVGPGRRAVALEGDRLAVRVPRPEEGAAVREALVRWLRERALAVLAPRTAHYAARLGLPPPRVAISGARTRWGTCSWNGAIRLSWRLVHLAPALADYVVAHEAAHLVELNHSGRFWRLVETLYPDWRAARGRIELAAAALPHL